MIPSQAEPNSNCESCTNTSVDCWRIGSILMCASCREANKRACDGCAFKLDLPLLTKFGERMLCGVCVKKEYATAINDAKARDKQIKSSNDYFVSKTVPICELKELFELVGKTPFELHAFVRERFEHFSSVLFTKSEQISSAQANQQLVIEFRAKVIEQIKASDIDYKVHEKAPKVRTPKINKPKTVQEKMAVLLIAAEAKRGNVITMQQALAKINADFA